MARQQNLRVEKQLITHILLIIRFTIDIFNLFLHALTNHRGRHAKIFGWAKSDAYDRRYTSDLWPITHNSGIGDKQKPCVMCVKFSKE